MQLAARGCRVAVHYRVSQAAANAVVRALPGTGHQTFAADLSDPVQVEALWTHVTEAFGPIDIVVNNAGIYEKHAPFAVDYPTWNKAWQRTLAANLLGPAGLCHLAANAMTRAPLAEANFGRGRIVNISSRGAFRGEPEAPAYGASKAALNALSQSLAKAFAPLGIYVFCLAPGWVETEMAADHLRGPGGDDIVAQHPLGRVTKPEEVAQAAVFCALDAPPAMTGAILDVNGASYLRT